MTQAADVNNGHHSDKAERWFIAINALRYGRLSEKEQALGWIETAISRSDANTAIVHPLMFEDDNCVICVDFDLNQETWLEQHRYMTDLLYTVRRATPYNVNILPYTGFLNMESTGELDLHEHHLPENYTVHDLVNAIGAFYTDAAQEPEPLLPY